MEEINRDILSHKKLFQNYFTKHLFQSIPLNKIETYLARKNFKYSLLDDDYKVKINDLFHKTSEVLWKEILNSFATKVDSKKEKWDKCFHFFLKGGKSYYLRLNSYLKSSSKNLDIPFQKIQSNSCESDYVNIFELRSNSQDTLAPASLKSKDELSHERSKPHAESAGEVCKFSDGKEVDLATEFRPYDKVDLSLDSKMEQPPNLGYVLASELEKYSFDSDFDFTFCINPENFAFTEDVPGLLENCINKAFIFCKEQATDLSSYFNSFLQVVNQKENQMELLKDLENVLPFLTSERDLKLKNYLLEKHIIPGKPFGFRFNSTSPLKFLTSKKPIVDNSLYLFRIVIDLKSGIQELDKSNFFSLFAEGIDVTYPIKDKEEVWSMSSAEFMNKPIPLLNFDAANNLGSYNYPIANLSYLLHDTLVVFYNLYPSKPESRCQRFLQQLYLSCLDQKLNSFPTTLKFSNKMWEIIINSHEHCSKMKEFFTLIEQDEVFTTVKVSQKLRSIDKFENWCVNNNFPFTKIKDFTLLYKSKIINQVLEQYKFFLSLIKMPYIETDEDDEISFTTACKTYFSKDKLKHYLHQFNFLRQLIEIYLVITTPQHLNSNFYSVYIEPPKEQTQHAKLIEVEDVLKYIISNLNSLARDTSIFICIQSNSNLTKSNIFAKTISKFIFRPCD